MGKSDSNLLISEAPLQVLPSLVMALDKNVDKAIIIQQVHYWLGKTNKVYDGYKWIYNSVSDWQAQFPWLSEKTVQRYLKDLEDKKILVTGNYNKLKFDRTKWYRIDYDALDNLTKSSSQFDQTIGTDSPLPKEPPVLIQEDSVTKPIPLDYPETNTENKNILSKPKKGSTKPTSKSIKKYSENSQEYKAAKYLFSKIKNNNSSAKEPNFQTWSKEFHYIFDIDKRDKHEVVRVIDWCQSDSFWMTNILSPKKLRDQYDRLKLLTEQATKETLPDWAKRESKASSKVDQPIKKDEKLTPEQQKILADQMAALNNKPH